MKFLRFLLFPLAILYDVITSIRNFLFDVGILKSTKFNLPVIVVGNLSVGGTGKTPQIEYLARLLKETFKTAILSRGYKRKSKGFLLIDNSHTVDETGDEPMQYFKKFNNISVAVDANRVEGISKLIDKKSPEVVLLDDAYQHRKVQGSLYILLTKYNDLFVDDYLLPTGNLRESRRGAKRAAIILVTKCPKNLTEDEQNYIKSRLKKYQAKVFFTSISYADTLVGNQNIIVSQLHDFEVLLVTGIANPKPLLEFLDTEKVNYQHLEFPDHHHFSESDINNIKSSFDGISSTKKIILTTEKDATRLSDKINNLYYLPIQTAFLNDDEQQQFNSVIQSHVLSFQG